MSAPLVRASKFLSLVLRHKPETIGLTLDRAGWASVDELITRAAAAGQSLSHPLIEEIVATSDKRRFALSEDGTRIRANQGHSFEVDLGLAPQLPPVFLFHGTATRFIASIRAAGLSPQGRQHVHLSADRGTALKVGARHGEPVVLEVRAAALAAAGRLFFLSANGVWLTSDVPPDYLAITDG